MMKFKDCKFNGKHDVREDVKNAVLIACRESIHSWDTLNPFRVEDYINLLIEETHYNPRRHYFYDKNTGVRINLKIFKSVSIEYILEHIDDFILEKYK